jgi:hypothetical protein
MWWYFWVKPMQCTHIQHVYFSCCVQVSHVFDPFGQFIFACIVFTTHCHHIICCQIISFFTYCVAIISKPLSGFT